MAACAAGALNQIMNARPIALAVSTTLGCWGFLLVPLVLLTSRTAPAPTPPAIPRSLGWIVAAVLAAAIFVGVLDLAFDPFAHYFGCGMMFTIRYPSFRMRK